MPLRPPLALRPWLAVASLLLFSAYLRADVGRPDALCFGVPALCCFAVARRSSSGPGPRGPA